MTDDGHCLLLPRNSIRSDFNLLELLRTLRRALNPFHNTSLAVRETQASLLDDVTVQAGLSCSGSGLELWRVVGSKDLEEKTVGLVLIVRDGGGYVSGRHGWSRELRDLSSTVNDRRRRVRTRITQHRRFRAIGRGSWASQKLHAIPPVCDVRARRRPYSPSRRCRIVADLGQGGKNSVQALHGCGGGSVESRWILLSVWLRVWLSVWLGVWLGIWLVLLLADLLRKFAIAGRGQDYGSIEDAWEGGEGNSAIRRTCMLNQGVLAVML